MVVLQSYKNNSSVAIEAKYVFPLGDMAAGEIEMIVYMTSLNEECNSMYINPLRPIAALAAIIDSTYSRRHKKCSRKVKSSLFAKDDYLKKPPVFRRALPTKTYRMGGILKGVSPR